jgi:hypothetical protein
MTSTVNKKHETITKNRNVTLNSKVCEGSKRSDNFQLKSEV